MPQVDRERGIAARVAGGADLRDVRLFGVAAKLETASVEGTLSYGMTSDISFQTVGEPVTSLVVTGEYEVAIRDSVDSDEVQEDEDPSAVGDLKFSLAALFALPERDPDEDQFADSEYEAFAATTGQFALYPYAREFIADITSRMGLPALHVGVLRFGLDKPPGD